MSINEQSNDRTFVHILLTVPDPKVELLKVIYSQAAKESAAVLQCRLINDNSSAFRFKSFHNALDATLAEVIAVALHGQTIYAYSDVTCYISIYSFILQLHYKACSNSKAYSILIIYSNAVLAISITRKFLQMICRRNP